jgi:hypothetical protein
MIMPRGLVNLALSAVVSLAGAEFTSTVTAQTVWSGLTFTFTKADSFDPDAPFQAQNQDRITNNVWLTRAASQGLLNVLEDCDLEEGNCGYTHNVSPIGTEWATLAIEENAGKTIAANNHMNLVFDDWESAYDNRIGGNILNPNYRDAVLHLIQDDIYLDIRFLEWTVLAAGGGFSYIRAVAPAAGPTGDYNNNGTVDAADYVLWRNTLNDPASPAGSGADGDSSGTVDAGDYTYWRARFGNTVPGSGLAATPVPEPTTLLPLVLGSVVLRFVLARNRATKI